MKRILVFGMTEYAGGVESFLMNYYRKMNGKRLRFDFLTNTLKKTAYEQEILAAGSRIYHIPARSRSPFRYHKALTAFFRDHAKEYDGIWVNVCSLANIDYLILAKKYGIPGRIIHSHSTRNLDGVLRGLLHQYNRKRIRNCATDFWACSESAAEWFYEEKVLPYAKIIPNAIDPEKLAYDEEKRNSVRRAYGLADSFVIGTIGRLSPEKNQIFLLDVLEYLLPDVPEAKLVLVGEGPEEISLRKMISERGLGSDVILAGRQDDIHGWLSAFDVFVLPSSSEGLSLAGLEAQANGLPCLFSADGIPENNAVNSNTAFLHTGDLTGWVYALKQLRNMPQCGRISSDGIGERFAAENLDLGQETDLLEEYLYDRL